MEQPKYILDEEFADNGEHSHWNLIESETGKVVWSEGEQSVSAPSVPGPWHIKVETSRPHPESGEWAEENTFVITDGNTELNPEYDLDEEVEQRIINALNSAGCKISSDNAAYFNLRNEYDLLKEELAELKSRQIAGVQWVKASDRLPTPFKVVACKYTPKSPDPRRDTELHWGYVSKDGIWDMKWEHDQVEWLDESGSSLSVAKEQIDYEKLYKEANQFILDLAKEFGEDSLGFDGIQWSIEDFKHAAKKWAAAKEQELSSFLKNLHEDWDCDRDSDKYGTPCRSCEAKKLYEKYFLQSQTKQQ